MAETSMRAAILGIPGPVLDPETAELLRSHPPAGIILFGRNVEQPAQLRALITSLRHVLPEHAVIMVDQEGGRVMRLRPPHFPNHPAAARLGALYRQNQDRGLRASYLSGAAIGEVCRQMGFDVVCAPVLDLALPGFDAIIGDRGFSDDPQAVAQLGRAFADGLAAAGVAPVMKHLPGHGRATVDSHLALPVRPDIAEDELKPFHDNADLPWAMTAHLLYQAQDLANPATLSAPIIRQVIRGQIGFHGVLLSDDLAMQALSGPPEARALAALAAGCDLALYCSGEVAANHAVLAAVPAVSPDTLRRMASARAWVQARRSPLDLNTLIAEREELLT